MKKTFSTIKKVFFYAFTFFVLLTIAGYTYLYVLPKGPEITAVKTLNIGTDSFVMHAYNNSERKSIKVWTYKPEHWKDQNKIVFVMHGGGRNAADYLDAWIELADTHNLLIVAPEFENNFSNITTNDYQEGNLFTFFGTNNPKHEWAFSVVENIFDHIKSVNEITNSHYYIFGHSAGAQFVHRMIMLMPESRITTAIAANAGLYTLPDENLKYPYGLKNTEVSQKHKLQNAYDKKLIILLGALDNDPALGTFRTTELAMQQGAHRLERGTNYYQRNKTLAGQNEWPFKWEIDTINNIGHDYRKMSENAIQWIIN
ncbi:alpha/beta hydrolase family protein [Robertkochia flava]|uniref:hypothetical protein n=1 Tax=Robertkochia flava TaxID=3447986 RepID=UPI001CCDED07|nr:hypothetical protein [Robertkochia marina]